MGDQAQVAATVSNLTEGTIKGRVTLQLFDPTTEKVILTRREKFEAKAGRNAAVGFAFDVDDRYPCWAYVSRPMEVTSATASNMSSPCSATRSM